MDNNTKNKKVTMKDLIAKKLQKEKNQFKVFSIYVESMGGNLEFRKLQEDEVLDLMKAMVSDDGKKNVDIKEMINEFKKIIYNTCELLQNPEIHAEMDIVNPYDIVTKLFEITEIVEIGENIILENGLATKGEEIKN